MRSSSSCSSSRNEISKYSSSFATMTGKHLRRDFEFAVQGSTVRTSAFVIDVVGQLLLVSFSFAAFWPLFRSTGGEKGFAGVLSQHQGNPNRGSVRKQ